MKRVLREKTAGIPFGHVIIKLLHYTLPITILILSEVLDVLTTSVPRKVVSDAFDRDTFPKNSRVIVVL